MSNTFLAIPDFVRGHARATPDHPAVACDDQTLSYRGLDALMDRLAATLQRDGLVRGDAIAICAATSIWYVALFLGALRAGLVVVPLAPSSTDQQLTEMVANANAKLVFVDTATEPLLAAVESSRRISLTAGDPRVRSILQWMAPENSMPALVKIEPSYPFNIIYSSGTTGQPKGIVQSHERRYLQAMRVKAYGYGPTMRLLLATPLYSNATLFAFFPALAAGGSTVFMPKFDAEKYVALAARMRATHTMLVPVQYQHLMALEDFEDHDLSSFIVKICMSAPFNAALKREVVRRWPGGLLEIYGMTEGGGSTILYAHEHPDKLHTVGRPAPGNDIRVIDAEGREMVQGELGEIVGRSSTMMTSYHGHHPGGMKDSEWFDAAGNRFLRSGDIGRFDQDSFLEIVDRKKDMIISGGFNVYPSDLEAELRRHPAVVEASVVGVPSERWGETPVAFVVKSEGSDVDAGQLQLWLNGLVGKTQRISDLRFVEALPRSDVGKILKRTLQQMYGQEPPDSC